MRGKVALKGAAVLLLAGTPFAAATARITVPIPGIAGPAIQFAGALRTNAGGAIMVARIRRHPRAATGTTLAASVDADGTLELTYGYEGVADLHLPPAAAPTALAINPATGAAWIGVTNGTRGEVVAIDPTGQREARFGRDGIVQLPGVDRGGVRAMAWRQGEIVVAASPQSACAGCALSMLNASNGTPIATRILTAQDAGGPTCTGSAAVTSVAFDAHGAVFAGTQVSPQPSCAASLVHLSNRLVPLGSAAPAATALSSLVVTPEPGPGCLAGTDSAGIGVWPSGRTQPALPVLATGSTKLIALVPLGTGGCGALLQRGRNSAEVAQVGNSTAGPAITPVPAGLVPLAMFRCRQHLLVIAARGPESKEAAVILPVPISRGPFAAVAAAISAPSTGCG
jgi:hypothetical protein